MSETPGLSSCAERGSEQDIKYRMTKKKLVWRQQRILMPPVNRKPHVPAQCRNVKPGVSKLRVQHETLEDDKKNLVPKRPNGPLRFAEFSLPTKPG